MTAVEWLEEQLTYKYEGQTLNKFYDWKDLTEYYNKAKEMEKRQITDAVYEFSCRDSANHYYVKTYGSKGSETPLADTFAPKKGIATRYAADSIDEKLSILAENASFANPILAIHEAKKRKEQLKKKQ